MFDAAKRESLPPWVGYIFAFLCQCNSLLLYTPLGLGLLHFLDGGPEHNRNPQ